MKTLEKAQDKIQQICTALRDETLEPAKKQAEEIVKEAQKQADDIVVEAKSLAKKMLENARAEVEQERHIFHSSMRQAAKQSLETLRQNIESKFFNEQLESVIELGSQSSDVVAKLINAVVTAIEKDGLSADLTAIVPKSIQPKEVNDLLLHQVLRVLREESVVIGNFSGGAKIKLNNKQISIDITQDALKELLASYVVRKDFRKLFFAE